MSNVELQLRLSIIYLTLVTNIEAIATDEKFTADERQAIVKLIANSFDIAYRVRRNGEMGVEQIG